MLAPTKKRPTNPVKKRNSTARFVGLPEAIERLRRVAAELGVQETTDSLTIEEAFPEYMANPGGTCLRGARVKEGLSQVELSGLTGIPQRHISEMEHGKRTIGKEIARRLAKALNVDYRIFL